MPQRTKQKKVQGKPKAPRLSISSLIVESAFGRTTSTGKNAFFGKVLDPATGKRYQVILAVELS